MSKPFDITLEREVIYQDFQGPPGPCPRCGGKLKQRYQSYLVATRTGQRMGSSMAMGGEFGWFCETCPTVILNALEVSEMLALQKPDWKTGSEFAVLGLINIGAVPAEKQSLPFGKDNPIPLVAFKGIAEGLDETGAEAPRQSYSAEKPKSPKPRRKRKR